MPVSVVSTRTSGALALSVQDLSVAIEHLYKVDQVTCRPAVVDPKIVNGHVPQNFKKIDESQRRSIVIQELPPLDSHADLHPEYHTSAHSR